MERSVKEMLPILGFGEKAFILKNKFALIFEKLFCFSTEFAEIPFQRLKKYLNFLPSLESVQLWPRKLMNKGALKWAVSSSTAPNV